MCDYVGDISCCSAQVEEVERSSCDRGVARPCCAVSVSRSWRSSTQEATEETAIMVSTGWASLVEADANMEIFTCMDELEGRGVHCGLPKVWVERQFGLGALEPMKLEASEPLLYHCFANAKVEELFHTTWVRWSPQGPSSPSCSSRC